MNWIPAFSIMAVIAIIIAVVTDLYIVKCTSGSLSVVFDSRSSEPHECKRTQLFFRFPSCPSKSRAPHGQRGHDDDARWCLGFAARHD
jgi:hypothetical protein